MSYKMLLLDPHLCRILYLSAGLADLLTLGCKRCASDYNPARGMPPTLLSFLVVVMLQKNEPGHQSDSSSYACIQAIQALKSQIHSTDPFFKRSPGDNDFCPPSMPSAGLSGPASPHSSEPSGSHLLTELDPVETIDGFNSALPSIEESQHNIHLNQDFRHSFWRPRRRLTLDAFHVLDIPSSRIDRFTDCGAVQWVLRAKLFDGVYRVASNCCRDRWCEACSGERRRIIVRNVRDKMQNLDLRLLTLTLKSSDDMLTDQLDRIYRCFRLFRNRKKIKTSMMGGLYFVEITLNQTTGQWHPHLHVLFTGAFLPHRLASNEWLSCTGDSFIIHLVRLSGSDTAASYVAKYAGKAVPTSVWRSPDHFHEAIVALSGRRLFSTFGDFTALGLSDNPSDDIGWEALAPLHRILTLSARGDSFAREVINYLTGKADHETLDLLDSS